MSLTNYRTLGRSGLPVSPLALGTMTFGTKRWGSPDDVSEAIFAAYVEAGGNFIDSADTYAKGRSEELLGQYVAARKLRDQLVLATKFTWNAVPGVPTTSGNGRKNIYRALEGSLRRLQTDYIDLYWLHHWDGVTPVEEVLQTLGDLVRAGKIRYFGFSNVPAWYVAEAATLARLHGIPGPIALQMEYSLTERGIEYELMPAAQRFGLGITPWSPLAAGFLTGKYEREHPQAAADNRLSGSNPFGDSKFTERNWQILDVLREVAAQLERPLAPVALAWTLTRPAITSLILGASKLAQLHDNLTTFDVRFSAEQLKALDQASPPPTVSPYSTLTPAVQQMVFGGAKVRGWAPGN